MALVNINYIFLFILEEKLNGVVLFDNLSTNIYFCLIICHVRDYGEALISLSFQSERQFLF